MTNSIEYPFMTWAPILRERGFWPRPVEPGSKATKIKGWQKPDPEQSPQELERWAYDYADYGIGVVTGSPFPDGTVLGALDIDDDQAVELGRALLHNPVCGRVGARGAVFFVRVRGDKSYRSFAFQFPNGTQRKYGELLCENRFCVLPPTIHPMIGQPYRWLGKPLHEVEFSELPIMEA